MVRGERLKEAQGELSSQYKNTEAKDECENVTEITIIIVSCTECVSRRILFNFFKFEFAYELEGKNGHNEQT